MRRVPASIGFSGGVDCPSTNMVMLDMCHPTSPYAFTMPVYMPSSFGMRSFGAMMLKSKRVSRRQIPAYLSNVSFFHSFHAPLYMHIAEMREKIITSIHTSEGLSGVIVLSTNVIVVAMLRPSIVPTSIVDIFSFRILNILAIHIPNMEGVMNRRIWSMFICFYYMRIQGSLRPLLLLQYILLVTF